MAGGLARHFDVDPVVVRVLLAVLTLFGGVGLFAYVALWIVVPEEGTEARPLGLDDKSRSVAVIVVGALALLLALGAAAGRGIDGLWWLWPAALITGLVLFINERSGHRPPPRGYGPPPHQQPHQQPPRPQPPQQPYAPPAPWSPEAREAGMAGAGSPAAPPPRPPNPRRRGPVLFWFTLALMALGIGVLGLVETAGVAVPNSAYPALALGIVTLMLLIGSFWGRPGGLIALGLVTALMMGGATSAERFEADDIVLRPLTSASAAGEHRFGFGEFTLDLTQVRDLEQLDGEAITIDGGVGTLEVLVPAGLTADVSGDVGIGGVTIDGRDMGGIGTTFDHRISGGPAAPAVTIDIDLGIGQVTVRSK